MTWKRYCGKVKYLGKGSFSNAFRDADIHIGMYNGKPTVRTFLRCNPGSVFKSDCLSGLDIKLRSNRITIHSKFPYWELHITPHGNNTNIPDLDKLYEEIQFLALDSKTKTSQTSRAEVGVKRKLCVGGLGTPGKPASTDPQVVPDMLSAAGMERTVERLSKRPKISDDDCSGDEESKENRTPRKNDVSPQNSGGKQLTPKLQPQQQNKTTFSFYSGSNSSHFGPSPPKATKVFSAKKSERLSSLTSGLKSLGGSVSGKSTPSPRLGRGMGVPRMGLENPAMGKRLEPSPTSLTSWSHSAGVVAQLQGFANIGNTCFMNAILQCLCHLKLFEADLAVFCSQYGDRLTPCSLSMSLARLMRKRHGAVEVVERLLRTIKDAISKTEKRFSGHQQQDAHEFLVLVLDQIKEESEKAIKEAEESKTGLKALPAPDSAEEKMVESSSSSSTLSSVTSEDTHPNFATLNATVNPVVINFDHELKTILTCLGCGNQTSQDTTNRHLSLPLLQCPNMATTQDALDGYLKNEEVDFSCEKCKHPKATMSYKFTKVPRVLILQLQRYENQGAKRQESVRLLRYVSLKDYCDETTIPHFPHSISSLSSTLKINDTPQQTPKTKPIVVKESPQVADEIDGSGSVSKHRHVRGHRLFSNNARRSLILSEEDESKQDATATRAITDRPVVTKPSVSFRDDVDDKRAVNNKSSWTRKDSETETDQPAQAQVSEMEINLDDQGFDNSELEKAKQMSLEAYHAQAFDFNSRTSAYDDQKSMYNPDALESLQDEYANGPADDHNYSNNADTLNAIITNYSSNNDARNATITSDNGGGDGGILMEYRNLHMTEEEQLEMALKQSVGEDYIPPCFSTPQQNTRQQYDDDYVPPSQNTGHGYTSIAPHPSPLPGFTKASSLNLSTSEMEAFLTPFEEEVTPNEDFMPLEADYARDGGDMLADSPEDKKTDRDIIAGELPPIFEEDVIFSNTPERERQSSGRTESVGSEDERTSERGAGRRRNGRARIDSDDEVILGQSPEKVRRRSGSGVGLEKAEAGANITTEVEQNNEEPRDLRTESNGNERLSEATSESDRNARLSDTISVRRTRNRTSSQSSASRKGKRKSDSDESGAEADVLSPDTERRKRVEKMIEKDSSSPPVANGKDLLTKNIGSVGCMSALPQSCEKRSVECTTPCQNRVDKSISNVNKHLEAFAPFQQSSSSSDELPELVVSEEEKEVVKPLEKSQSDNTGDVLANTGSSSSKYTTLPENGDVNRQSIGKENISPGHSEISRPEENPVDMEKMREIKKRITEIESGKLPWSYRLVSVINHHGISENAGHYSTDICDIVNNEWKNFDDKTVTNTTEAAVRTQRQKSGYIFIYLSSDIHEDIKSLKPGYQPPAIDNV